MNIGIAFDLVIDDLSEFSAAQATSYRKILRDWSSA